MKNSINLLQEWKVTKNPGGWKFSYPAPEGAGFAPDGFDTINEAAFDVSDWYGLVMCLRTEEAGQTFGVTAGFTGGTSVFTEFTLAEAGEHSVILTREDFSVEKAKQTLWRNLDSFTVEGTGTVLSAKLKRRRSLWVETDVLGKAQEAGETVSYLVKVHNCLEQPQMVRARQSLEGWESLEARIEPEQFCLPSGEYRQVKISIQIHDNLPPGAHEKTIVHFVPEGDAQAAEEVSFYTLRRLPHPYIYHTAGEWKDVAEQIKACDCFQPRFREWKKTADDFQVPPIVPLGERDYCYDTSVENSLVPCAYLYAITGREMYAEKIAAFFREFSNPEYGYPVRKKGCSQSYVQEGHFFAHLAMAYDMVYDAEALGEEDHSRIENCLRIYMSILDKAIRDGHISNWTLSEVTGAVYSAMVLQDYERIERFVYGPGGTLEQLCHGTFTDGWWHECTIGYNTWVASMFLHTAHAMRRFGVNMVYDYFPVSYGSNISSVVLGQQSEPFFGAVNDKWGGISKGYIQIKDLFDAIVPFLDERGVMFGINDSDEKKIEEAHWGSTFDLAYTYYRNPAYIPVIRNFDKVDPAFGHSSLPECEVVGGTQNACADNIGILMLRSKTPGRRPLEQIQAVLRYGAHGGAHGHYDKTELLSLMRYGRSFYNPEHVWWGYGHYLYKFYVQNSNTKNMVTVDGKMQQPADARKILFYSGKRLQAGAVRATVSWGYPPFGGMIYNRDETFAQRCELNASGFPDTEAAPYSEITELTEEIRQTRVMAVLDDCIVLFDSMEGEEEHCYESILQIRGFESLESVEEGGEVTWLRHTGKKSENPKSDEQFITDCDYYRTKGVTRATFRAAYGPGVDMRGYRTHFNEPGVLCMDVYTAWPPVSEQSLGLVGADLGQRSPYEMKIWAGNVCAQTLSGMPWLLGAEKFSVSLSTECQELRLEIQNLPLYTEQHYPRKAPQCLFLADSFLETVDGRKISLTDIPFTTRNIDSGCGIGKDYEGGRVLIEGEVYADAIPVSTVDHSIPGELIFDLRGLSPVRVSGLIGVDNFPGEDGPRERTYGVAQRGRNARFVTVIEPHEGHHRIRKVSALNENSVEILYEDGEYQEVHVEDITGSPVVSLRSVRGAEESLEHS